MSTAYLVLLVLLIVYVPIYIWVYKNPEKAERCHLVTYGPALMIKTHLGINLMGRIGRYQRFWRFVGFLSKLTSAVLLFLMMYTLIVALMALPSMVGNSSIGIEYALAIPGFNPILPLSYGIAALLFAMVVHELGHGIQARSNGIDVDSSGLLYGVVPLGAFVEPNEEQMKAAPRRPRMDVYTAGITMNTFWAIVAIAILMLSCASISSPYDDEPGVYGVDKGSPAYDSGIPLTALITGASLEGSDVVMPVDSAVLNKVVSIEFEDSSQSFDPTKRYTFQYIYKGDTGKTSKAVQMGAFVNSVVKSSPADTAGIAPGMFLYSITLNGEETLVGSINEFTSFMKTTSPGDTVVLATVDVSDSPVVVYHDPVALTASGGIGFLGVVVNMGGFAFTTPDILMDRAASPMYNNDGSAISYVKSFLGYLSGPMNGMSPIPDNVKWWYDSPAGDLTWVFLSLLYWIFWLDILLAISNALPAYPFDGGFIFAGFIDWALEKTGMEDSKKREDVGGRLASAVSNVVLLMFVMVIVSFLI